MVAEAQAMVVAVAPIAAKVNVDDFHNQKKNRIQVSNTKKPLFFYLNLAKRYIKQHSDVELSALGMAIPTAVTIAEILKANGVAVEKKVLISTIGTKDENKGRQIQKAKLEIVLEKNENMGTRKTNSRATKDETKIEQALAEAGKIENQKTPSETAKTESKTDATEKSEIEPNEVVQAATAAQNQ